MFRDVDPFWLSAACEDVLPPGGRPKFAVVIGMLALRCPAELGIADPRCP